MPLLYVAIAYLAGVLVGAAVQPWLPAGCGVSAWPWLLSAALIPLAPFLNRLRPEPETPLVWGREFGFRTPRSVISPALIAACALALCVGALRYWSAPLYPCLDERDLAWYNVPAEESFTVQTGWQTIDGYVASHVAQSTGRQRITVAAQQLGRGERARAVRGNVTLLLEPDTGLHYGDPVQIAGVLSTPAEFADFSWRDWLARRDILSTLNLVKVTPLEGEAQGNPLLRWIYALRSRGETVINTILPEPYAALANGMILGIDANIPDALMQEFNDTSSSHVIVISGSNIALIAGVLMALGSRFGKNSRWIVYVTLTGIGVYAVLVGAEASVVRAAIMGGLLVIATALGRSSTAIVSLAAAALAMTVANPHILWDVGFQLSAVATLGLILLVPALRRSSDASDSEELASAINPLRASWAFLGDTVAVSLAATLAVTPLLIWHFHRLSVIGLLTNLLIVPVQPLILISGLGGLIAGIVGLFPLARLMLAPAWLGLVWTVGIVQLSAEQRWASVAVGGTAAAVVCGLCVIVAFLVWRQRPRYIPYWLRKEAATTSSRSGIPPGDAWARWLSMAVSPTMTGALVVIGALAWLGVAARPDGDLHVWFLPAERGQAVLIQSPTGRQVLVDGGDDGTRLLSALGSVMGFWDRSLDQMLLTSDDERTMIAQTALANRLQIDGARTMLPLEEEVAAWGRMLAQAGVAVEHADAGSRLDVDDGLSILLKGNAPAKPGVIEIRFENVRILLPGSSDVAPALLAGESTVISVPAFGRASARTLLQHSAPANVVIYNDDSLAGAHYPNEEGVFHLRSDGQNLWLDK